MSSRTTQLHKEEVLLSTVTNWFRQRFGPDDATAGAANSEDPPSRLRADVMVGRKVRVGILQILGRSEERHKSEAPEPDDRLALPSADWDGILDALFWSGYTGTGDRDAILERIDRIRQTAVDQVNSRFSAREEALTAKLDALRAQRLTDQASEPGLRQELQGLETERTVQRATVQKAREALISVFARLESRRSRYGVRQLEERLEQETILSKQLAQNTVEIEESRTQAETALLNRELARREVSGVGYEAYRARLEERARHSREQMESQARLVGTLRSAGMTERVTGFFVWAGYLGLVAFGWRLGDVLHLLTLPNDGRGPVSTPSTLIPFLADNIYNTFVRLGVQASLTAILAFILLWLAGSYFILRTFDGVLSRFDDRWDPDRRRRARAHRKRKAGGEGEKAGGVDDGVSASHRTPARQSATGAQSQGIGFREIVGAIRGDTDRADYVRYLARAPLVAVPVLLSLLVLLFFAAGEQRPKAVLFTDPLNSLLYLMVGLTTAAALTGFICLLIQPVVARMVKAAGPAGSGGVLSRAVLVLPGATIAMAVGASVYWGPALWGARAPGGPLLLLGMNAVVLGHGLVYRNVHRDYRTLKRDSEIYEARLWSLNPYHVIQPRDLQPWSLHERWVRLQEELTILWDLQDGRLGSPEAATVVVRFTGVDTRPRTVRDPEPGGREAEPPRRRGVWKWWPRSRRHAEDTSAPEPTPAQEAAAKIADDLARQRDALLDATRLQPMDLRLEPDLSAELLTAQSTFGEAHVLMAETDARIAEVRARIKEITGPSVDEEVAAIDARLRRLGALRENRVANAEARYTSLWQEGAGAHEAGKKLAQRVAKISATTIRP